MKHLAKIQAKMSTTFNGEDAVTITLETVLYLILIIVALSGIWAVVIKYIIGDEPGKGFFGMTKSILEELFG